MIFEELEGDERCGEEGDIGVCHALPEEAQILVQSTHAVRTSWPPEASLGVFVSVVYPVQGKPVEHRGILIILAYLDKFALPILVGLLEDREDRPPTGNLPGVWLQKGKEKRPLTLAAPDART